MSEAKFTPVPWHATSQSGSGLNVSNALVMSDSGCIAFMKVRDNEAQVNSDARLIAAAPDLLKSLQAIMDDVIPEYMQMRPGTYAAINNARRAIAKALGE